jgi:hypothetical protein
MDLESLSLLGNLTVNDLELIGLFTAKIVSDLAIGVPLIFPLVGFAYASVAGHQHENGLKNAKAGAGAFWYFITQVDVRDLSIDEEKFNKKYPQMSSYFQSSISA